MSVSALSAALTGLRASQAQIDVLSANIANASTPGYTRKILPQTSQSVDGVTIGVNTATIVRNVSLDVQRSLWTQISDTNFSTVKETFLQRIERFHGPPDQELSIAAEVANLQNSFSALSEQPEDFKRQQITVDEALNLSDKINDFAELIQDSRSDVQAQIEDAVGRINFLLEEIASANNAIVQRSGLNSSIAAFEDERDFAIQELSEYLDLEFFKRADGVLVVQTSSSIQLAGIDSQQLSFRPVPLGPQVAYPDNGAAAVFVGDPLDPDQIQSAFDITTKDVGGRLGGLIELRDETFPKQRAQLDELAHKLAIRFNEQGLRLFTDASGQIPGDTAPALEDQVAMTPAVPVEYVGFSSVITVNREVLNDNTLVQQGTVNTDIPIQTGSNEVISRVIENVFGDVEYQQINGTVNLDTGGASLQDWLGVFSENTVTSGRDVDALGNLVTNPASPFTPAGADTFRIVLDPNNEGLGATTLSVDLNAVGGAQDADSLAIFITGLDPNISATVNPSGQLEISSRWDIEILDGAVNPMGNEGFQFLGLNPGLYEATDPYFDVQVGNTDPVRITIEPGDTQAELLDKLVLDPLTVNDTGVPGLAVDEVTFLATGELIIRPGDDFTEPAFGGGLSVTSGPFEVDAANAGFNAAAPPVPLVDGINIVSALFGSYNLNGQDLSPLTNVSYQSETEDSSGVFLGFREDLLGPGVNISTNIRAASSLLDYAQKMVNEHSQELIEVQTRAGDDQILQDLFEAEFLNGSGVNVDEELGNLILFQTTYSASARVIGVVEELFDDLLNAVN